MSLSLSEQPQKTDNICVFYNEERLLKQYQGFLHRPQFEACSANF